MTTVKGSQFTWEGNHGVSEASSLQLPDLTSLNVSNLADKPSVKFDLERREYRQGELVAWHLVSTDALFSLTVFND